jgi:ParB family transcriptional regulator, chromosome partitioning protein
MSTHPPEIDFFGAVPIIPEKQDPFRGLSSRTDDNDWYTPSHIVELARQALGGLDLDPASCALANETVRAGSFYDKHANGLEQRWFGKVWLNPPYSKNLIAKFAGKLLHEYENGNVESGILLSHNCSETNWFQICAAGAQRVCFPDSRLQFRNPSRSISSTPARGQTLFYFGKDPTGFTEVFGEIGIVLGRAS